jgi:hypothetical protein
MRFRLLPRSHLCLAAAFAITACSSPQEPIIEDAATVIYGTIRSELGGAVEAAEITLGLYAPQCEGSLQTSQNTATDPSGSYRAVLTVKPVQEESLRCVKIHIDPPAASNLRGATLLRDSLRLVPGAATRDSVRVDWVLKEKESRPPLDLEYDLQADPQGWEGGFADYGAGREDFLELVTDHRPLPPPLDTSRKGMFISGNNHDDDLFMFLKRPVTGLQPNQTYRLRFYIELATNAPSGCAGVGGAPGEGVSFKAGASLVEPTPVLRGGDYRMNIDKGNQANGGSDMFVLGHIGNSNRDCLDPVYEIKAFNSETQDFEITTDEDGSIWLIVGTDSGFEATTSLYYTFIGVGLEPL